MCETPGLVDEVDIVPSPRRIRDPTAFILERSLSGERHREAWDVRLVDKRGKRERLSYRGCQRAGQ